MGQGTDLDASHAAQTAILGVKTWTTDQLRRIPVEQWPLLQIPELDKDKRIEVLENENSRLRGHVCSDRISHWSAVDLDIADALWAAGWRLSIREMIFESPAIAEVRALRARLAERDASLLRAIGKRA
jgi:hypothetical protein